MWYYRKRLRNRLRQIFYRPKSGGLLAYTPFSGKAEAALDDINKSIETNITPLLKELFD